MTGSAAIDILIGLFTLYFVMSTLASALVEVISNLLGFRAKMLNTFLSLQFKEPKGDETQTKLNTLYTSLGSKQIGTSKPTNVYQKIRRVFAIRLGDNPKYLSSVNAENFTQALYDAIGFTGNEVFDPKATQLEIENYFRTQISALPDTKNLNLDPIIAAFSQTDTELQAAITIFKTLPEYVKLSSETKTKIDNELDELTNQRKAFDFISSLPKEIKPPNWLVAGFKAGRAVDAGITDLKTLVSKLPDSQIRNVLTNAIQKSDEKLLDVSTHVAEWFDGEMERLKDVYRRRTQVFLFLAGLIIAFWLNVDTIAIANALAKNPSLRDAVVEQAKAITSKESSDETVTWNTARTQLSKLGLPTDWDSDCNNDKLTATLTPNVTPIAEVTPAPDATTEPSVDIDSRPCLYLSHLNTIGSADYGKAVTETNSAMPGILITAAAVALGAPFWFDLLKSLTSRSSSSSSEGEPKKT